MARQFDYQGALKAGHAPADIQAYLQQNPDLQVIGAPTQTLAPQPTQQPVQQADTGNPTQGLPFINPAQAGQSSLTQSQGNNGLLDFLLPTGGAIAGGALGALVPGLGETGISEVGGAAAGQALGKALENVITGKNPTADVLQNAGQGALGGVTGLGMAKLLGPILGGVGGKFSGAADNLLGKPTQDIFNSVVQKDPWMLQNTGKLANTAKDLGYMDQPLPQSLAQMPQDFKAIDTTIKSAIANNDTPMPIANAPEGKSSLLDNFQQQLQKSSYGEGNPEFDKSVNGILQRMSSLSDNGATDASTIYGEKQNMSNILSNTYDRQAKGTTLSPKEEVNLAYQSALKSTLDQYGSPEVRALNTQQNHLYDIAKAFGTTYSKQAGKAGAPPFSFRSLFPEELGGAAASIAGVNPLVGAALGYGASKVANSPAVLEGTGSLLSKASAGLKNPLGQGLATGAGATGSNALASLLGGGGDSSINATPNTQTQEQNQTDNTQHNAGSVSQSDALAQQDITKPDQQGNYQLPQLNQVSNEIPNQPYPIKQQMADLQRAGSDPFAYDKISRAAQANSEYVNNYVQQNQLDQPQKDFMANAQVTNNMMNQLRQLVNQKGGKDLFSAVYNGQPTVQWLRSQTDPQYAKMASLMTQLGFSQARSAEGGRPSNYDVSTLLGIGPEPSDTAQSALAKLDTLQQKLVGTYANLLPRYGLSLQAQQPTVTAQQVPQATQLPPQLNQALGLSGGATK